MDSSSLTKDIEPEVTTSNRKTSPRRTSRQGIFWISFFGGITLMCLLVVVQGMSFGYENLTWLNIVAPFVIGALGTFFMFRATQHSLRRLRLQMQDEFERQTLELRRTEERFHEYTDTSREWYWETDADNRFTFLSSHLYEVSGARPEDILGRTRNDLKLAPENEYEEEQWAYYDRCIAERKPFENFRYRGKIADGRELVYRTSGRPYFDQNGEFLGYRGSAFDVSEELREVYRERYSHELIYSAMAMLNDGFVLYDGDDRLVLCNDNYRELYKEIAHVIQPGTSFEEITRAYADTLKFADEEEKIKWVVERVDRHRNRPGVYDHQLKNGNWIQIIDQRLPDGSIVGLRIDISEMKHIEEELENAQQIAQIGSYRWDLKERKIISCSMEFARIIGIAHDKVSKFDVDDLEVVIHPDDRDRVRQVYADSQESGEPFQVEFRIVRPSGEIRNVVESGVTQASTGGDPIEQFGAIQDITERVQEQSERIKSEETLQAAIENAPGGFILLNAEGNIERFNRKFFDLYPDQQFYINEGIPYERFLRYGAEQGIYLDSSEDPDAWLEQRLERLHLERGEFYDQLSDGRWIRVAGQKLPDGSRVGMHVDVTELHNALESAEQANAAKSEFLASMSHELRTPMHGILSFTELGLNRMDSLSQEKLRQYLENIQISGTRLLYLLNDLLDLSKLEAGKMNLDISRVNLLDLVNTCIGEQEFQLRDQHLTCELETDLTEAGCFCDRNRLFQVFSNVITNAIKFSPEGSDIRVSLERIGDQYRAAVSDQGAGIPSAELDQIFTKFYQSEENRNVSGGTGLGLAICREIIEMHHGRIWAENNADQGSSIFFEFPVDLMQRTNRRVASG